MKKSTLSAGALIIVAYLLFATSASAQCNFPACSRDGERFNSETGNCEHRSGFPTFAISHRVPSCPTGEHFDRATGNCVLDACDEGCEARRLCRTKERYSRSGSDREGVYGVCESSSGLGYKSHVLRRCPAGFTLNERRGVCVRCPIRVPVPVRLPDLIIRRAFLRIASNPTAVTRIRAGTPYLACFEVANIGSASSGTFRVEGGGLGVPTSPGQNHASLAPGESREGCLEYSGTPPPGTYRLQLHADSLNRVRETREGNNTATVGVTFIR
jgi:hypothetical protein